MLKHGLLLFLAIICTPTASEASGVSARTDLGVACLDEQTGELIWEYFPEKMRTCGLATDGEFLYLTDRWFYHSPDELVLKALDLQTGALVEDLPPHDPTALTLQIQPPWTMTTSSGLRVGTSSGNDRVISILKPIEGKPDELVHMIHTDYYTWIRLVSRNLVLYSPYRRPAEKAEPLPHLIAIDARTGERAWTLSVNGQIWGLGRGSKHLLVCEEEGLAFVDPATGKIARRTPLPRARGSATVVEKNGKIYVACNYSCLSSRYYDSNSLYLYCIDRDSGEVRWTFDPLGLHRLPILVHDGKVYTLIGPSISFPHWRSDSRYADDAFLAANSTTMEVYFRAWHQLGDRSILPFIKRLHQKIKDERLHNVVDELIQTFPRRRDMRAFLQYLKEWYDLHPEAEAEIRDLLETCDPRPIWLKNDKIGFPPQPPLEFPLNDEEHAIIDFYSTLRKRLDPTFGTALDKDRWHRLGKDTPAMSFAELLAAHHASNHESYRERLLACVFRYYPMDATAWADENLETLGSSELETVVVYAPIEWLAKKPDRLAEWLKNGSIVSQHVANRLGDLEPSLAERLCVDALQHLKPEDEGTQLGVMLRCIRRLGQLNACDRQGPLLQRFLESSFSSQGVLDRYGDAKRIQSGYPLRYAAIEAFKACGIEEHAVLLEDERLVGPEDDRNVMVARKRAEDLHEQMLEFIDSGARDKARDAAKKLMVELQGVGEEFYERDRLIADAFETLERWDELIAQSLGSSRWTTENSVFHALLKAKQYDKLESFIRKTRDMDVALGGAFVLIEENRLASAKQALLRVIESRPNDAEAFMALALVHKAEARWQEADGAMTRALAIRPKPYGNPRFHHMMTYWLDRGMPGVARKWLAESATRDYRDWKNAGLFEWAAQYAELRETANRIRQQHGDPPISRFGNMGVLLSVGCFILLGAILWRRRTWRSSHCT